MQELPFYWQDTARPVHPSDSSEPFAASTPPPLDPYASLYSPSLHGTQSCSRMTDIGGLARKGYPAYVLTCWKEAEDAQGEIALADKLSKGRLPIQIASTVSADSE